VTHVQYAFVSIPVIKKSSNKTSICVSIFLLGWVYAFYFQGRTRINDLEQFLVQSSRKMIVPALFQLNSDDEQQTDAYE